jgi:hypothetical protein
MLPVDVQTYAPVLRLKEGEYKALGELVPSVSEHILPHFVLPPPKDRDPELGRALEPEEMPFIYGRRVGAFWPRRTCLIDPRFLFSKLGTEESVDWLPLLLKFATAAEARAIPVATLEDLEGPSLAGFHKAVLNFSHCIALRITLDDLGRPDLRSRIHRGLLSLVLKPSECVLILDFSNAELSAPEMVAEITLGAYQSVMEIGLWGRVIWQGTSYPESNPAAAGGVALLPRNEWRAWSIATRLDSNLQQNLMFGDFGADCAKFSFASGGIPIRHYRYSTPESWFVVRGVSDASAASAMKGVASCLVQSEHFAGRNFSSGDAFIADTAEGVAGPGNATTWRQMNTIHHLTRVVKDLIR